jgi:glycosyltransferase involved in cell wall biosynthesis
VFTFQLFTTFEREQNKMRILYYGETPVIITGFSQVTRHILGKLYDDGHEITCVAMNHFVKDYDKVKYPYEIVPCHDDEGRNTKAMIDKLKEKNYDCFFYAGDLGGGDEIFKTVVDVREQGHTFLSVCYSPVDCDIIPPATFNYFGLVNAAITYTKHAKSVIEKYRPDLLGKINVIPLGCDTQRFYCFSEEERKQARKDLFGIEDDTFIFLNINRNQHRKDLGRSIMIFHEFHKIYPKSLLYLHSKQNDIGGSLPAMCQSIGMSLQGELNEVIFTHPNFHEIIGTTSETVNKIYNACDCLISTSTGEGWGLSTTEAMSAGLPVIVPRNTANIEIVGSNEERGLLIESGGDVDHMIIPYGMSSNPRSIVHSSSMLDKMITAYNYPSLTKVKSTYARTWCENNTWDKITEHWSEFFKQVEPNMEVLQCAHS